MGTRKCQEEQVAFPCRDMLFPKYGRASRNYIRDPIRTEPHAAKRAEAQRANTVLRQYNTFFSSFQELSPIFPIPPEYFRP